METKAMSLRFAVIGLYNSGSTALAGMLHRLGANLGPPFWRNDDDSSAKNYYEAGDLAAQLRWWWDEPNLIERMPATRRTDFLRWWIEHQEGFKGGPAGAKHPLLSLCCRELLDGWGPHTRFIWSWREFDASVDGLVRRRWFRGREAAVQQRLWDALHAFERSHDGVVRMNWQEVKASPAAAARQLADLTGLAPTAAQLSAAAAFVQIEAAPADI
jgi:hypothetical protein